ncbi:hypothetical protein ES702_02293 [subsurface metagenome]
MKLIDKMQTKKWKIRFLIIYAGIVISVVVSLSFPLVLREPTPVPERVPLHEQYWFVVGTLFILMLIGMLAREAYNKLTKSMSFNWTSFFIASIVSPIIFGAVYGSISALEINVPSVIFCFQNGFFWNSIFERLEPTT